MNDSRLADTVSFHWIFSGAMPSFPATILATSTSKPSGAFVRGFSRPKPGWSNLVPIVTFPASWSLAIVEPAAKLTLVSTAAVLPELSWAWLPAWLEQPASTRPNAATVAAMRVMRMNIPSGCAGAQWLRIFDRKSFARSELGRVKKVSGSADSTMRPPSMNTTRLAARRGEPNSCGPATIGTTGRAAGEAHLVRDDDHRHSVPRERRHHVEDLVDHLRVERRGRLVEEHDLRVHGQGARDRHALLLAARQLRRVFVGLRSDADPAEQLAGAALGLGLRLLADLDRAERHVLEHRLVREEVEALEHHADVAAQPGQLLALLGQQLPVDGDLAGVDPLEPVDRAAQRRLARPGRADDDDHLAAVDEQVDVLEDVELAEPLVHTGQAHQGLGDRWAGHEIRPYGWAGSGG